MTESHDACPLRSAKSSPAPTGVGYVAINYIRCQNNYRNRFECLFCTRAKFIDQVPGFLGMKVLRCEDYDEPYLVLSYWKDKASFDGWVGSPAFFEGHKRAFADLKAAKERGEEPPMTSDFLTYEVLTD